MRKWFLITPIFLLAACSRTRSTQPTQAQAVQSASAPAPAAAQPDPMTAVGTPAPAAAPVDGTPAPSNTPPDPPPSAETPAATAPALAPLAGIVIPRGTFLRVRVDEALSTRRNFRGDRFTATLTEPVIVDGRHVLPSGTRLTGHVLVSKPSGRLKGRAFLELELDSFERDGHRYSITTAAATRVSGRHRKRNILAIGGGAGSGAAIGAIAGGGIGAAVGAGAGAAVGTVAAAITGRKQVTIPAESVIRFRLGEPVRV